MAIDASAICVYGCFIDVFFIATGTKLILLLTYAHVVVGSLTL